MYRLDRRRKGDTETDGGMMTPQQEYRTRHLAETHNAEFEKRARQMEIDNWQNLETIARQSRQNSSGSYSGGSRMRNPFGGVLTVAAIWGSILVWSYIRVHLGF